MFEYAISRGEGTLLDYGVARSTFLNEILPDFGYDGYGRCSLQENGTVLVEGEDYPTRVVFSPAGPDCETGE